MKISHILAIGLLSLLPVLNAKAQSNGGPPPIPPRIPVGIYAVVPIEDVVKAQGTDLSDFYTGLLNNPAVSGLALQIRWDTLNPNPPGTEPTYTWDDLDKAFSSVNTWNANNAATSLPKTIQLIVSPGFNTPPWMVDELPTCGGLFEGGTPGPNCGKIIFTHFQEQSEADHNVLPMPWDLTYQKAWYAFLTALSARYNAMTCLVSVAVAGPTAVSVEMLLPNSNRPLPDGKIAGGEFAGKSVSANDMWDKLLTNIGSAETDLYFADFWGDAIAAYAGTFSNLTLVATTGSGFPNLKGGTYSPATGFGEDCPTKNMDCQAETQILSYFIQSFVGETNAKATQTSGLEASHVDLDLGIDGVKFLTKKTMAMGSATTRILGGAQFSTSVVNNPTAEGSTKSDPSPSINQALYNVLGAYFDGTPAAGGFFGETLGTAPMNYLQIYYEDIQYGTDNTSKSKITLTSGKTKSVTFQDLLNMANDQLKGIAEPEP